MLVLCKVKAKHIVSFIFWVILFAAFGMGIFAIKAKPKQPVQVDIPLRSVYEIQTELNARGYDIKVDGKFGPETDHALCLAITKQDE